MGTYCLPSLFCGMLGIDESMNSMWWIILYDVCHAVQVLKHQTKFVPGDIFFFFFFLCIDLTVNVHCKCRIQKVVSQHCQLAVIYWCSTCMHVCISEFPFYYRLACWVKLAADDILKYTCISYFFPENRLWYFMPDNLHEVAKPVFWKSIIKLSSA